MIAAPRGDIDGLVSGRARGISFLRRSPRQASATLVLLHGIGSNARSFAALMEALPAALDVIAWNAPGYAESDQLAVAKPVPRDYADALAGFLSALGLGRVALAGHSLGTLFAASFARHYPDTITALALVSPSLGYGVNPGDTLPQGAQSRIDDLTALGPAGFAKKRAPNLVGDPRARPDVVAAVEDAMARVHAGGYTQAVYALGAGRLLDDAARIAAPTMVAVGLVDRITPPANARQVQAALAKPAGYHEISGAGHVLPQEEPQALARLLVQLVGSMAHA
jgi:pimeloyl-ACP methyl ester carboxylesterase